MKITSVQALPASAALGPRVTRNFVFVRIETDAGITGWGEATSGPLAVATMIDEFGQLLVGADPMQIERHWQTLYHHFHVRGGVVQMSAISGIEIALWDIKGRALDAPIYELLGGKVRDRIWTYGRWDGPTPEASVRNAMAHVERGLTALKGDPFEHRGIFMDRRSEDLALEKMRAVREAVGDDVELLVEVHGRLSPADAIRVGNRMEEHRPFYFRGARPAPEPEGPEEGLGPRQHPHRHRRAPADQVRLRGALPAPGCGPDPAGHHVRPAESSKRRRSPRWPRPTTSASSRTIATGRWRPWPPCTSDACTPNFVIQEGGIREWYQDATVGDFPLQTDGYFDVPPGPGLGVAMSEEWLAAHPWDTAARPWAHRLGNHPSRQGVDWS